MFADTHSETISLKSHHMRHSEPRYIQVYSAHPKILKSGVKKDYVKQCSAFLFWYS